jgi:hypothetical protein
MKFFLPKALMLFFTPTPESSWLSVVVRDANVPHAPVRLSLRQGQPHQESRRRRPR